VVDIFWVLILLLMLRCRWIIQ